MRIDGISDMKREMNGDQWLRFQTELEKCLIIHLEVHCDYYLKNRFIEFDKYQEKRIYESCKSKMTDQHCYNDAFRNMFYLPY